MEGVWNPWHGCKKHSEGCLHCYVYRRDESIGKDASLVTKTKSFRMPVEKNRAGQYKIQSGEHLMACLTSDFFIDEADEWRREAWDMIRERSDVHFTVITKRIERVRECLPDDWGKGYENFTLCCTVESQRQCSARLPVFLELPLRHRQIICEPLLDAVDLSPYLSPELIGRVVAGGESGPDARVCDYSWVLEIREQCIRAGVSFHFKQTGAVFRKDGKVYAIKRQDQYSQAKKAGIDI